MENAAFLPWATAQGILRQFGEITPITKAVSWEKNTATVSA
jgi:hypothetical protein